MRCDVCVICDVHLPIIPYILLFFSKQINGTFSSHASLVSPRNRMSHQSCGIWQFDSWFWSGASNSVNSLPKDIYQKYICFAICKRLVYNLTLCGGIIMMNANKRIQSKQLALCIFAMWM